MDGIAFDIAHMLAGGLVLVSFMLLYQQRIFALLNVFALHALMLGFVFSMVFGHAPVIFPAVLRVSVPYHPVFYAPLALLHLSLALRLAGDLAGLAEWRSAGGALNALALLAFILNTIAAVIRGKLKT